MAAPTGNQGPPGNGGNLDPTKAQELAAAMRAAQNASDSVTSAFEEQLKIIMQMKDAMGQVSQSLTGMCSQDCGALSPDTWTRATKSVTDHTGSVSRAQKATEQLSDVMKSKLTKSLFIGSAAVDGFAQGWRNLSALTKVVGGFLSSAMSGIGNLAGSVIAFPFKMMSGLFNMAQQGGGGEVQQALEDIRKEFGDLKSDSSSTIKEVAQNMNQFNDGGATGIRVFGNYAERLKAVTELAKGMGAQFQVFGEEVRKNGEAIMRFNKGLGITNEQMQGIGSNAMRMGKGIADVQLDMTKQALGMSKAFGVNAKVISKDMAKAMNDLAHFGSLSTKEIAVAATFANKLGVSVDKLTGIMDATKTFDQATEGVAKLNEQFNLNIDATKLMMAENPADQISMVQQAFKAAGKDISQMNRFEKDLLKQNLNLDDAMLASMLSTKGMGVSLNDISKQGKKNEDKTMSQAEAMHELADSMERIVKQGQSSGGIFSHILEGLTRGIKTTPEFIGLMRNINKTLREATQFGYKLGKMFVDLFPGVRDMLGGLKNLFDPKNFRNMFNGVLDAFKSFAKGGFNNFDDFMKNIKKVFFSFFNAEESGGKKFLGGLKKFVETGLKILAGMIEWVGKEAANLIYKVVDMIKSPPKIPAGGGGIGAAFKKVFEAVMKALEALAPAVMTLLQTLAKVAWDFITSEKFLSFMKKAGPVIALVLFGPAFIRAVVGQMSAALAAAAADSIKNAFLGPGSKKLQDMTGKQFSDMMKKASASPGACPPTSNCPVIPPNTPDPGTTANAQATGKIIDGPTIIKLLLALAAIIAIGLVAFYAASKMVANMSREQIENALLVLAGVAIAILPAAGALAMLSGVPPTTLLASIPAMLALGLVIPYMASVALQLTKDVKDIKYEDILKALLIIGGMSLALIPAAFAMSMLASAGSIMAGPGALLVLAAMGGLALIVPAMGALGIILAQMASSVSLVDIIKATTLVTGMSLALAIAAGALAALVVAGAIAGSLPLILIGITALGIIGLAMFEAAPELAKKASRIELTSILKALAIMGAMAIAAVEVTFSMVALGSMGVLAVLMGLILMGLDAFKTVSLAMLAFAPELGKAAAKVPLMPLIKVLAVLGLMAVAVVEVLAQMILLGGAGILSVLMPVILMGLEAFKVIAIEMIKFAPVLGEAASAIDTGAVGKALGVLGMMAISVAQNVLILVGLGAIGLLMALVPLILLGFAAYKILTEEMMIMAKILELISAKIDAGLVGKALGIIGLMSISIAQSVLNVVLLAALGALIPLAPLVIIGFIMFKQVTLGLMDIAKAASDAMASINVQQVISTIQAIALISIMIGKSIEGVLGLALLGGLILYWPVIKLGVVTLRWTLEEIAKNMPDIAGHLATIASYGFDKPGGPLTTIENISKALGSVAQLMGPLLGLGIMNMFMDVDKSIAQLSTLITSITPLVLQVTLELNKMSLASGMKEKAEAFGEIMKSISSLANVMSTAMNGMDTGFFTSSEDKVKQLAAGESIMKTLMSGVTGIIRTVIAGIEKIGASPEQLDSAKALGEVLSAVAKIAQVMKPSDEAFKAAGEAINTSGAMETMITGMTNMMKSAGPVIEGIITVIGKVLIPSLKGFTPADMDAAKAIGGVIQAISQVLTALQPPKEIYDIIKMDVDQAWAIFAALRSYFTTLGPIIESMIGKIAETIPQLIGGVKNLNLTPADLEILKVVGPIIGSLAQMVGALIAPATTFLQVAASGSGFLDKPKDFTNMLGKFTKVLSSIREEMEKLIGPSGPIGQLLTMIGGMDASKVEAAGKIAPLISAVAGLATALSPSPEVLKAITEAAGDEKKMAGIMLGVGVIAGVVSANISPILGSIKSLIQGISGLYVSPEQVAIIEKLGPVITGMITMVSKLTESMIGKGGKIPTFEDLAIMNDFFNIMGIHITKMLDGMTTHIGKILFMLMGLLLVTKASNIKPDEMKAGTEAISAAIGIVSTLVDMISKIGGMMKGKDQFRNEIIDPKLFTEPLDALTGPNGLLTTLFTADGPLTKIAQFLTDPLITKLGKNKDGITALKDTFELISKLPTILESFASKADKPESGVKAGDIDVGGFKKKFENLVDIFKEVGAQAKPLDIELGKMDGLSKKKDLVPNIVSVFQSLGTIGNNLMTVANLTLPNPDTVRIQIEKVLNSLKAITSTTSTQFGTPARNIANIADDFKVQGISKTIKAITDTVKVLQDLDDALSKLGKVNIATRLRQAIGGTGLGSDGVYTVKAREVALTVNLKVFMSASEVESAIVYQKDGLIRDRINALLEGDQYVSGHEGKAKQFAERAPEKETMFSAASNPTPTQ